MSVVKKIILFTAVLLWAVPGYCAARDYRRIVSLGPQLTEALYLLSADDRLIADTVYCTRPPEAKAKEKVGNVVEVSVEKIVVLKPDIVLATGLTNKNAVIKLKSLGIEVRVFRQPQDFSQICQQFSELGDIVGKPELAGVIINSSRQRVEKVRARAAKLRKVKVFVQIGADPLVTVRSKDFINDLVESAGGANVAKDLPGIILSRESVLAWAPEYIFIVDMGLSGDQERKAWLKFNTISAKGPDAIRLFDSYELCSPTPVVFADTLEKIARILHPANEAKDD